jgi:hypothetical protein
MIRRGLSTTIALLTITTLTLQAGSSPHRARLGMVITQSDIASQIGFQVIRCHSTSARSGRHARRRRCG